MPAPRVEQETVKQRASEQPPRQTQETVKQRASESKLLAFRYAPARRKAKADARSAALAAAPAAFAAATAAAMAAHAASVFAEAGVYGDTVDSGKRQRSRKSPSLHRRK